MTQATEVILFGATDSDDLDITVVMATYNGERYLREQLDSIVGQLVGNDELVISDDRSTDATPAILQEYVSDAVRVVSTEGRLGPVRNFEHGLSFARRRIIVLSDQDDRWLPGRLARVRAHFADRRAPYDLLVMNSIIADRDLNPTHGSLFEFLSVGPGLIKNVVRNTYVGCHLAFRRELLELAVPFPATIPMHDMWLGLVSEAVGPVVFDPEPTMLFRRSGHNYTQTSYPLRQRIVWRLALAAALLRFHVKSAFRSRQASRVALS